MGEHVERLLDAATGPDHPVGEELVALQLAAANERVAEQRSRIPALDRRATDAGIDQVRGPADLVPLLFAHSVYKSYPESFLFGGRWDRMSLWLDTVSSASIGDVDVSGVTDADEWIARLDAAGIHLIVSSGTNGKQSFIPLDDADVAFLRSRRRGVGIAPRPVTFLGPSTAPMRTAMTFRMTAETCGRPGAVHSLTSPFLVAQQIEAATLRRKMADETALPSEVNAFQARAAADGEARERELTELLAAVVGHRDEPQIIFGQWAMLWRLMEAAQATGVPAGSFHPDTLITLGGGLKGLSLPDGYDRTLRDWFAPVPLNVGYGMSELTGGFGGCDHGAYHCPPWILPLVLDEAGETLLEPGDDGRVRGRFAAFDSGWNGMWGGIVSGDQVTLCYAPCPCGKPGPTLGTDIVRYSELSAAGDDKLTCGGTIEAYIRGVVA